MSHPQVAEAVAFGCPDEKYGEIVAAAIVPNKPIDDTASFAKDLQKQAGQKMAAFKVSLLCTLHLLACCVRCIYLRAVCAASICMLCVLRPLFPPQASYV